MLSSLTVAQLVWATALLRLSTILLYSVPTSNSFGPLLSQIYNFGIRKNTYSRFQNYLKSAVFI